jgi:hypothetical protein
VQYWRPIPGRQSATGSGFRQYEKNLSQEIADEFPIWQLVFEKIATLEEIERSWSYDDVLRAVAIIDMRRDLEQVANKRQRK